MLFQVKRRREIQKNVDGKIGLKAVCFGEGRNAGICAGWWDGETIDGGWSVGERCP